MRIPLDTAPAAGRALAVRESPVPAIALEFHPDVMAIEARPPRRLARLLLYSTSALIAASITWASLADLDEVTTARGKLVTTQPTIVIQPIETGVIRSIVVKVGDRLRTGQVVATLDPTFTEADVQQLRARYEAADAMTRRLEAEMAGTVYEPASSGAEDRPEALEAKIFRERADYVRSQLRHFDEDIARLEANRARYRDERAVLDDRLVGVRAIETMRETLFSSQTGSKLSLLQARDARLDLEAALVRLRGSMVEAQHELEKTQAQREAFLSDFRRTTLTTLAEARVRRDGAAEELKKTEMRRRLVVLTAPADGVVLETGQRSVGSVLREAEPLITLVPTGVPLEAEVQIESRDIGHVSVGQLARLKFDAFPFQKHGTAAATVRTISQDALPASKDGAPQASQPPMTFRARLDMTDMALRSIPDGFRFLPGMSVQAEIRVGERSVISYLLYPLRQGLDEALRER